MSMKMDVRVAQRNIRKLIQDRPKKVLRALNHEANIEVTEMKRRCPVDVNYEGGRVPPHPGNLRNSIHAEEPEYVNNVASVKVATGPQAPYDVFVHENPDALHPVGEWQFMASVISESRPYMAARVAARIKF